MDDQPQNGNLTTILVSSDTTEVATAKSALDEAGIAYSLKSEGLQNLYGPGTFQMEIQVAEENAPRARQVLADYWNGPELTDDTEIPDLVSESELDPPPTPPSPALTDTQRGCLGFFIAVLFVLIASGIFEAIWHPSSASIKRRAASLTEEGRIQIQNKDYATAAKTLTQAIQSDPGNIASYGLRAHAFLNLKDFGNALSDLNQVIGRDPKNAWALQARSIIHFGKKDYEKALEDLQKAINLDPTYAGFYHFRGDIHTEQKKFSEAIEDAVECISLAPEVASNYSLRAYAFYRLKDYERAILNYDEVIRLKPDDSSAFYYRSRCHSNLEQDEKALRDAEKSVELAPSNPNHLIHRAWMYRYSMQYDKAMADCLQAVKLKPDSTYALHGLAEILDSTNETTRARETLNHALELDSTSTVAAGCHLELGWLYYRDEDYTNARREYEIALNLDPERISAHYNHAESLAQLGLTSEADKETSYVMQETPERSYRYACRGEVRRISGDFTGAIDDYNEAIKLSQGPYYYGYRGLAHLALGKTEEANQDLEKCYTLDKYLKPRFEKLAAQVKDKATSGTTSKSS